MKAVVRRVLAARSDLGDCDSAPSLLDRRFLACTITSCVGIDRTKGRRGRDHRGIARPGEAVVSSLPALALLQLVEVVAQTLPDHPGDGTAVALSGGLRPRGGSRRWERARVVGRSHHRGAFSGPRGGYLVAVNLGEVLGHRH